MYILKTKTNHRKNEIKIQLNDVNDAIDKMITKDLYVTQKAKYQRLQKLHLTLREAYDSI